MGIASGEPTHQSIVLWTRLATGLADGGGMAGKPIQVKWQIASDPGMRDIVKRGVVKAHPASAHAVRVPVSGLPPDAWYWYQFGVGSDWSPIGRTRTFPKPGSDARRLKFAFVSCQHCESGFYTAYEHLAQEDLDFVVHLGDYIYEDGASAGGVRQHIGDEIVTLADYRARHAQYRSDPHLQAAHARFPFIVTWDDHEVENNYAGAISEDNDTPGEAPVPSEEFLRRRADAYQAYFEHMPLAPPAPAGSELRLFRRFRFGRLAELNVLDTRQFRSNQPCGGPADQLPPAGDDLAFACGGELDPAATMTGARQEDWLLRGLRSSDARWNVLAQQVMMSRVNFAPTSPVPLYNMDAWDGYAAARNRVPRLRAGSHRPQCRRPHGRHPFELGRRPAGELRRRRLARRRHGVRRHVDHLRLRARVHPRHSGRPPAPDQQPREVLRRSPAGLRPVRGGRGPLARGLSRRVNRAGADVPDHDAGLLRSAQR